MKRRHMKRRRPRRARYTGPTRVGEAYLDQVRTALRASNEMPDLDVAGLRARFRMVYGFASPRMMTDAVLNGEDSDEFLVALYRACTFEARFEATGGWMV